MLALPAPVPALQDCLQVPPRPQLLSQLPTTTPPTADVLPKVSEREFIARILEPDPAHAESALQALEHGQSYRYAEALAELKLGSLATLRDDKFFNRLLDATDRMGESLGARVLLNVALTKELPAHWRDDAGWKLIERSNRPSVVGQTPHIRALLELAKETPNIKMAYAAARALGSSKLRGFESLASLSFYLSQRWDIQPEAHRGLVHAVVDMYPALRSSDRGTVRDILGRLRGQPTCNSAAICRACWNLGPTLWLTAPVDLVARTIRRLSRDGSIALPHG